MAANKEAALASPPSDGVSALRFSPVDATTLLAASWDGCVRLYDTAGAGGKLQAVSAPGAALLDTCFSADGQAVYAAGLDRTIRRYDPAQQLGAPSSVGGHGEAVRCLDWAAQHSLLLSGSWDRTVKAWDVRQASGAPAHTWEVPDRVYSMTLAGPDTLVVATAGRHVLHFDLRKGALAAARESQLKHQTRVVRGFVDGSGYATGSIEGRVAIDFVDASPLAQAAKYAFKCHRAKGTNPATGAPEETVHAVHAIAFHPVHGTFATGGGDGFVSMWDWLGRKRLQQTSNYGAPVSALAFSKDGSQLAIGAGYSFEQGPPKLGAPRPADTIVVRAVGDGDMRPKAPAAAKA